MSSVEELKFKIAQCERLLALGADPLTTERIKAMLEELNARLDQQLKSWS